MVGDVEVRMGFHGHRDISAHGLSVGGGQGTHEGHPYGGEGTGHPTPPLGMDFR